MIVESIVVLSVDRHYIQQDMAGALQKKRLRAFDKGKAVVHFLWTSNPSEGDEFPGICPKRHSSDSGSVREGERGLI